VSEPIKEYEEMYLKALYQFHMTDSDKPIRTSDLAKVMGVSAAAASEMVQRLASKGFLDYERYKGAKLSDIGVVESARIKRREGLMEVFLVRMLDYQGDVNAAACKMEHGLNNNLESAIDRLLGYPEYTPDGDLIPQIGRDIQTIASSMLLPLRALPEGLSGKIELLVLEGADARTMEDLGIVIGAIIRSTADGYYCGGSNVNISSNLSSRILVRTE